MIAMTTSNSTSVKPRFAVFIELNPLHVKNKIKNGYTYGRLGQDRNADGLEIAQKNGLAFR